MASYTAEPDPLAVQINKHLNRYAPRNRFATAPFIVGNRDSGELRYLNASHNPPNLRSRGLTQFLESTGCRWIIRERGLSDW
jgi:hypothetical protein